MFVKISLMDLTCSVKMKIVDLMFWTSNICEPTWVWINCHGQQRQELGKEPFVDILAHLVEYKPISCNSGYALDINKVRQRESMKKS